MSAFLVFRMRRECSRNKIKVFNHWTLFTVASTPPQLPCSNSIGNNIYRGSWDNRENRRNKKFHVDDGKVERNGLGLVQCLTFPVSYFPILLL